jgi:hypothetical protein
MTTACAGHFEVTACRWRPPQIDRLALIQGFNTRTMEMQVTPPPGLGFAWTTPQHAAFVACAVFTSNPVFTTREVHNEADDPATSSTVFWQIANADACMLELQATDTSRSSLPIDGTQRHAALPACTADREYDRVIDFVAAGCWAYDSSTIIAASELVPIAVADLATVAPAIPADAKCLHDNDACYDATHAFFGACFAGKCEPRCTSPEDCEVAGMKLLGRDPASTCPWECRKVPTSLVGVCVPLAP